MRTAEYLFPSMRRGQERLSLSGRSLEFALIASVAILYAVLLTSGKFNFFFPREYGLVFNSMLDHLLHGRVDIDPDIVGNEGYVRGGLTYSYWGIFCALLRLPLVLRPDFMHLDVTGLSCWVGATLAASVKVHGLFWLRRTAPQTRYAAWLFVCLLACFVAGGPLVANLEPTIYSEPIFWAYAMATLFVVAVVKGFVRGHLSTVRLTALALFAGLCLLARASTGIGLLVALAVLLLWHLRASPRRRPIAAIAAPCLIACAFLGVNALINAGRWGSPFVGQDLSGYVMLHKMTEGVGVIARHGMLSIDRIPLALQYYLAPLWPLSGGNGDLVFASAERDLFYTIEMPPSSLLLTDFLPIALGLLLLREVRSGHTSFPRWTMLGVTAGLLAPTGIVVIYWALTNRYRIEFAPALDATALLAFALPRVQHCVTATRLRRASLVAATLVSVGASLATFILYRLAFHGDVHTVLRSGFKAFYQSRYQHVTRSLGLDLPFSRQR